MHAGWLRVRDGFFLIFFLDTQNAPRGTEHSFVSEFALAEGIEMLNKD